MIIIVYLRSSSIGDLHHCNVYVTLKSIERNRSYTDNDLTKLFTPVQKFNFPIGLYCFPLKLKPILRIILHDS